MFSFCHEQYNAYQKDYEDYTRKIKNTINQDLRAQVYQSETDICNLRYFQSKTESTESFVIVPSLFNSPDILMFNDGKGYIEDLRDVGDVYLIQWKEIKDNIGLADYVNQTTDILKILSIKKPVHLVGHCIGGNIAIFASIIYKNIASLTLLTTPWDYSHFTIAMLFAKSIGITESFKDMTKVPRLYMQIMFFMLFANQYDAKIQKYFAANSEKHKEKYLQIEQWLQSGIDIPAQAYTDIIDNIIIKNALITNDYEINGHCISLAEISVPTCIIAAVNDQIAPVESIVSLQEGIKNSTLILVQGGHISYLVNDDQEFKKLWMEWFSLL